MAIGEGVRQRHAMGEGKGPMKSGDFGVSELPGRGAIKGDAPNARILSDKERCGPPPIGTGKDRMHATAHSNHGPHR